MLEKIEEDQKDPFGVAVTTPWWLIVRSEGGGRAWEALTVERDGVEALAVFSFGEEAEMFLGLQGLAIDGWRIRESRSGELASVLCGPCAGMEDVALALPEMRTNGALGLVCVGREAFSSIDCSRAGGRPQGLFLRDEEDAVV